MSRGVVRVYLGAAPGVGTTFAMLAEGRRRADRGADVVVGAVDTHGRGQTTAMLEGFEMICGASGDLDANAVLARQPRVVLIDDLAGTDGTGGARWRDVDRIAAMGIDVVSTLWVGHIESQVDLVERITGHESSRPVPDAFLARVDQVELVDMTPEALRRRLAHGNIYAPDEIDGETLDLFRPGTLTGLRQLSLLWVANRLDEPLLSYMDAHGIAEQWETRERVVVAVTGAPGNESAIRRAARLARRGNGALIGVHVTPTSGVVDAGGDGFAAQRDLLVRLGGRYHEVVGNDIARALIEFTAAERATQLVIGASNRSRVSTLRHGSVVNTITRELRGADLHVIAAPATTADESLQRIRTRSVSRGRERAGWLLAVIGLPAVVMLGVAGQSQASSAAPLFGLLAIVALGAAVGGARVGVAAAVAATLLANWYFTAPRHTLRVARGEDVIALIVFVAVAALIATLVGALGRQTSQAERSRAEAEALARSTGTLIGEHDPLTGLLAQIRSTFMLDAVAILEAGEDDTWRVEASAGEPTPREPADGEAIRLGATAQLVLVGPPLGVYDQRLFRALADQLGAALERRGLHERAAKAELYAAASNLRAALLQSVSHDLRTPLASIKASVSSLLGGDVEFSDVDRIDLLQTIDEESDRLDRVVGNLLDMSRLQANALSPMSEIVDLEDAVGAALAAVDAPADRVRVELSHDLPAVIADPGLLERALSNLLSNALAWTPSDESVQVDARSSDGLVILRIADRGPGIPTAKRSTVFEPFQRLGDRSREAGVGLGLAVAKGFIEAMGGRLDLDDTPGGGLSAFISLPMVSR
jgi:two-component system sensor histidine kinase KdpD